MASTLTKPQKAILTEIVNGVLNSTERVHVMTGVSVQVLNNLVQKRAIVYTTYRPTPKSVPHYKVQVLASAVHLL